MANHRLITSGSLSSLQSAFFREITKEREGKSPFHPVIVLCGSSFLGHYLARELARSGVPHAGIGWVTFNQLADELAGHALQDKQSVQLPGGGKELLVRKLARELGGKGYFAGVHDLPHFASVMAATLTDIEDSLIDFSAARKRATAELRQVQAKIGAVGQFYEEYRAGLATRRWLSEADLLAEAGLQAVDFANRFATDKLFVYGFYEMTGAQREFLRQLLGNISLTAFLVSEAGDNSRMAVSKPLHSWWLSQGAAEEGVAAEEATRDLTALRRHIFKSSAGGAAPTTAGDTRAATGDESVRVLSCPHEVSEAREIAREAIRLKRDCGIEFTDMAVLVRDSETYLPLMAATFGQVGVPFYLRDGLPLDRSGIGRSLLALLRLPEADYRRGEVMQWLTLGVVASEAPLTLWDRLSAQAGIVEGESQWREKLQGLVDAYEAKLKKSGKEEREDGEIRRNRLEFWLGTARELQAFALSLLQQLNDWRRQTTWAALADAATAMLCSYHRPGAERDQVQEEIAKLAELDRLGEPASSSDFVEAVASALAATSRQEGKLERTGVHLLSLASARHTRFRVVFIPGLVERSFPQAGRQDPILLDDERRALSAATGGATGLPLKSLRPQEERLLFLLGLEAARERVVLTEPRADATSGAEKSPSNFLLSSLECLEGRPFTREDLHRSGAARVQVVPNSAMLHHDAGSAMDAREFDLSKVADCLASRQPEASRYLEQVLPGFACAVTAEQAQWGSDRLTAYDGLLGSEECRQALAGDFPDDHVYSPTALETYATCPYHFFLQHVLKLKELEEPEAIEELDALSKGNLYHHILEDFYREMQANGHLPLVVNDLELYNNAIARLGQRRFKETEQAGLAGPAATWELDQKLILEDLRHYVLVEIDRGGALLPQEFEMCFGMGESPVLEVATPVTTLRFRGKVDRLDLSADRKSARVIDYKSGSWPISARVNADLAGGTELQLPLYLLAAKMFYPEISLPDSSAEYYYVTQKGGRKARQFRGAELAAKDQDFRAMLQAIVTGCRNGIFPRCPEVKRFPQCGKCEFTRIGDPRREALWEQKLRDPQLGSFLDMREKE
ncbi:MAG: PD-(D/E)XK nuclease family protein [Terriglobales bacterium]|jgi:ATP-dependent helicase/DNAse subunit B